MKTKLSTELRRCLTENKKSILVSVVVALLYFIFIGLMNIRLPISIMSVTATGYYGEHNVSMTVDGSVGIVMALVLLIHKRKFASFREVAALSLWSSFFTAIAVVFVVDILLIFSVGLSKILSLFIPWIIANFEGVVFSIVDFTVISAVINGVYFKITGAEKK